MISIDTIEFEVTSDIPNSAFDGAKSVLHTNLNGTEYKIYDRQLVESDSRSPRIRYNATTQKLKVRIPSLPYFCHSNSSCILSQEDLENVYSGLNQLFFNKIGDMVPDSRTWNVKKLDVFADYKVGLRMHDYLVALANIELPKYIPTVIDKKTVRWENTARSMQFYDRQANAKAKVFSAAEKLSCEGILRFETSVEQSELLDLFEISSTTFEEIANKGIIESLLSKNLNILCLEGRSFQSIHSIYEEVKKYHSEQIAEQIVAMLLAQSKGFQGPYKRTKRYELNTILSTLGIVPTVSLLSLDGLSIDSPLRIVN